MPAGRPLTLPGSIQDYDFEKLAKQERHARTRMRLIAFAHLKKGKRIREAAEAVGFHETTLGRWIRNFKKEGIEGLKKKKVEELKEKFQKRKVKLLGKLFYNYRLTRKADVFEDRMFSI